MTSRRFTRFFIAPIHTYQYVSRMFPGSCRYYPTCSEYAKWEFLFDAPHRALAKSTLRIARCNQLFPGGIDYPVVSWQPPRGYLPCRNTPREPWEHVAFFLIPKNKSGQKFMVVKVL